MYCKNCGAETDENARYCVNCGYDLNAPAQQYSRPNPGRLRRPSSNLALSIITTVMCCFPFGVVGIVYATKVDPAWNAGNYEDAWIFSRKARNWCLWGIGLMLLFYIVYIALIIAGVSWASWWENGSSEFFTRCLY